MTSMRAMVGTLREETPSALPYRTIGEVVAALTDSFADPGMTVVCSVDAGLAHRAVPANTLVAVHHTIQEALTNVMRHAAGATRVEIGVRPLAGSVEITVTDDGGNAPAASTAAGFGLRGLGERMETVGGSLAAGPGPHGGWRVTAALPLPSRSRLRSYVA
ncbi:sensor histidine kinase [Micromonospora avicenniae]|uniref:sensor histidine kinase n=1 Tax=Micromonospora avicenniae TaxID=1198245 RepID=UPI0034245136